MAQFSINIEQVRPLTDDGAAMARELIGYADEIRKIAERLSMKSSASSDIKSSLRSAAQKTDLHSGSMSGINSALTAIIEKYDETERKMSGYNVEPLDVGKLIYKSSVAASGLAGSVIDIVKNFTDGEWAKGTGGIIKLTGSVVKNIDGEKANWFGDLMGNLFGVYKPKPGEAKTIWETATGKYFNGSSVKKGFASVCNWAATLIESGYDNYKEFEGFKNPRSLQETAVETGLKVVEGVAITALVAGVIGTGGVPLVASAITAGVTVVVDWGVKVLTGANWKEAISDGICDFSEWLDESAGKAGKWVGEKVHVAVDWAAEKVTDAVDTVKSGIANGINTVKNGIGSLCSWGEKLTFG